MLVQIFDFIREVDEVNFIEKALYRSEVVYMRQANSSKKDISGIIADALQPASCASFCDSTGAHCPSCGLRGGISSSRAAVQILDSDKTGSTKMVKN